SCPVVSWWTASARRSPGSLVMRRSITLLAVVGILIPLQSAQAEEPLVQKVRKSLDGGISYLKSKQIDQGGERGWNWENDTLTLFQPGGSSCLAMLALLTAGVPADDRTIKNGMPYIRTIRPQHTYVVGLQTMVLAELGDVKDVHLIERNVNWLL